jgi:hypothetical protein
MSNLAERIRQCGRDAMKDAAEFREHCDKFAAILEGGASTLVETAREAAEIISGPQPIGPLPAPGQLRGNAESEVPPLPRRPDGGPRR